MIKPDFADAHNNLGVAAEAKGDLDEAISHYKEALRNDNKHPGSYYNLIQALQKSGKPAKLSNQTSQH